MATVTILSKTRISCCLPSSYFLLPLLFCTCSGVSALQHGEHLYCYSKWLSPNFREYGRGKTGACCLLLHFHSLLCDVEYQLKLTLLRFLSFDLFVPPSGTTKQLLLFISLWSFKLFSSTSLQSFLMRRKMFPHQSKIFRFLQKVSIIYTGCFNLEQQTTYMWWQQVPF